MSTNACVRVRLWIGVNDVTRGETNETSCSNFCPPENLINELRKTND